MSPGHVFHPGHDEWHGQTVVVRTNGPLTIIGRWDAVVGDQVRMLDAAVHDTRQAPEEDAEAWVSRLKTYGVPVEHQGLTVEQASVTGVVRLRDA